MQFRGQAGSLWIQLDEPHARQQVVAAFDQMGTVTPFPQGAGPAMSRIEGRDITSPQALDGASHRFRRPGRDQQVNVVGHQHVGVQGQRVLSQNGLKLPEKAAAVLVICKDRLAVVAPNQEMVGEARDGQSCLSCHSGSLASAARLRPHFMQPLVARISQG